jgi:hypothetical protein
MAWGIALSSTQQASFERLILDAVCGMSRAIVSLQMIFGKISVDENVFFISPSISSCNSEKFVVTDIGRELCAI